MPVKVSLTQFLTFNATVSTSAKINYIEKIKQNTDYSPAFDYWKELREAIKNCLQNKEPIESLLDVSSHVRVDKQSNYLNESKRMIHFVNNHDIQYFETGHATWSSKSGQLVIAASPELGLTIDGKDYFIKNYYKKRNKNQKVTAKNIQSTLALMNLAKQENPIPNIQCAVLNLQNEKLLTNPLVSPATKLALDVDADTLVNIWNTI